MLNIKFTINNKSYRLESSKYDFLLSEVKEVLSGKTKGEESKKPIGGFANVYEALRYIPDHHLKQTDCTSFLELEMELKECMSIIKEVAKDCVLEYYLTPEDLEKGDTDE